MSGALVRVETEPPYVVHVGGALLGEVAGAAARFSGAALLVDARVAELHGGALAELAGLPRLEVPSGEESKSVSGLESVLDFLAAAGLDRRACLVTLGGGVVSDLGGLAASLYKRGIAVVHAPTTLLAQVDASVGGKTAINLRAGKNLAGTFHQPAAVFADVDLLATLADTELRSGFGEMLKTALVGGEEILALVESNAGRLVERDAEALTDVVAECVRVKARVVASDPTERGARRALNLGHTFAHAIEHAAGYGKVPHGVAVAAGIGLAFDASRALGLLADEGLAERVARLAEALGLPRGLAELREQDALDLAPARVLEGFAHDKKGAVGAPELVLPIRAGQLELGVRAEPELLSRLVTAG